MFLVFMIQNWKEPKCPQNCAYIHIINKIQFINKKKQTTHTQNNIEKFKNIRLSKRKLIYKMTMNFNVPE